jgi:hypothetical protein
MFLRFVFEGAELLSSPHHQERAEPFRTKRIWSLISALAGGGAGSNAVTRIISWHEIAAEQPEARKAGG